MRKNTLKNLTFGLTLSLFCLAGSFVAAEAFPAFAEDNSLNAVSQDKLITPSSYEQYLPLTAPSDVAFSDDYTAVADGNILFVYDRLHGVYRKYEHTVNNELSANKISKVEFADDGDLYFLDASSYLYHFPMASLSSDEIVSPTETKFACSTFTIEGNTLYFTNVTGTTNLSKTTLDSLDATKAQTLVEEIHSKPAIAFYEHRLYYTDYGIRLMRVDPEAINPTPESVCVFDREVKSVAINADELYYTDTNGAFYAYNFTSLLFEGQAKKELAVASEETGDNIVVSPYEDFVYLVQGGSVREYECGEGWTGFELSSSSDSENRLQGAVDSVLLGDFVLTADAGNNRISVYSRKNQTYRIIPSVEGLLRLATDGETVTAMTATKALIYDLSSGELLTSFETFNGKLVGVASVYGTYYLVSDTNHYYKLFESADETTGAPVWKLESSLKQNSKSPRLMTSDVYGNLYVTAVNNVYKFTETEVMDEAAFGEEICSAIPTESTKLLVDYEERVYALYQNTLYAYENGVKTKEFPLGKALVYTQTEQTPVTTVAFGVEDNDTYIVYNGNLTVCTADLNLPTVNAILTEQVSEEVFGSSSAQFTVVETSENAILVAFDLADTKDTDYFSYLFYERSEEKLTALQIGETTDYGVLAVFDKQTQKYTNYVVLKRYLTELDPSVYRKEYAPTEQTDAWLTNAIHLYKFPYLTTLLTSGNAVKNQKVTLLGEVTELDYDYYLIAFTDGEGNMQTGFVPMSYVTHFNGAPPQSETSTYGESTPDINSLYRMAYLLLGTAAIALLVDFLLLRKKEDE